MLGITTLCHFAECCVLFIVALNAIMLNVIMPNVIMLNVIMLNVIDCAKYNYAELLDLLSEYRNTKNWAFLKQTVNENWR
jgi:hypothetical protein